MEAIKERSAPIESNGPKRAEGIQLSGDHASGVPFEYLLKHLADNGAGVFLASMRTGDSYWRGLLDGGFADYIGGHPAVKRVVIETALGMDDLARAEEVLRAVLERLPKTKQRKFFDGPSIHSYESALHTAMRDNWERSQQEGPAPERRSSSGPNISALVVKLAKEYGADFFKPTKFKFRRGGSEDVSPLERAMIDGDIGLARTYLDVGHPFGSAEVNRIEWALRRNQSGLAGVAELIDLAMERAKSDPGAFAEILRAQATRPEAAAVFHAVMAKNAMADALSAAKPAPRPS
jgi:hypothetical protein